MYASFLENLTATSREKRHLTTMATNAMETISWETSRKKANIRRDFSEESIYTYSDDELSKKKEVNSTGSRLYVPRLSNQMSLPRK